jgi:hypothetical protein
VWLLISRRTLGEISVTIRGHPHALPHLPTSSKRRFLLRSDDNFGESQPLEQRFSAPLTRLYKAGPRCRNPAVEADPMLGESLTRP